MEIEKRHFNGSEESAIRERMVRHFDGLGFDAGWEIAMNISDVNERQKYYAVLKDLDIDYSEGFQFEIREPLVSERPSIKDLAESAMAATTLLVSNCKETIQRFVADEPQH